MWFNVTAENQKRADERLPILLELPFKHKGFMAAPLLGEIHAETYLAGGQIESILVDGENYSGARPCDYQWVRTLYDQAVAYDIPFTFVSTGEWFMKNGKMFHIPDRMIQREQAIKSGMQHKGKSVEIKLRPSENEQLSLEGIKNREILFKEKCRNCYRRENCFGCTNCGECRSKIIKSG